MVTLRFRPDGTMVAVYEDAERTLGAAVAGLREIADIVTRRASHVEPDGEGWTADMAPMGGPVLGPFPLRADALAAEHEWLDANL